MQSVCTAIQLISYCMSPKFAKCCLMAKRLTKSEGDFAYNNTSRRLLTTMWLLFLLHSIYLAVTFAAQTTTNCPKLCECSGETVKCVHKGLTTIPANVSKSVTNLDLSGNNISFIEENGFLEFPKLIALNLNYNKVKDISSLGDLPKSLQHLYLQGNKLTSLVGLKTNYLNSLDVSDNNITIIDDMDFQNCKELQELYLENNQITHIADQAFTKLQTLKILKLNGNGLQKVPKLELKILQTLDLSDNKIGSIPYLSFQAMPLLQILIISNNKIKSIATAAFYKLQLKKIYLDNNLLTSVKADWLFGLHQLLHLYLRHNKINNISELSWDSKSCCGKLKIIDLANNKLERVLVDKASGNGGRFPGLRNLVLLNLSSNGLFHISDDSFKSLQKLKVLDLSENRLSWTSYDTNGTFQGLKNLKKLDLGKNEITSIVKVMFEETPNLIKLDITNNPIEEVTSESFSPLKNLKDLRMNTHSLFCGCKLQWFLKWLKTKLKEKDISRLSMLKCREPKRLYQRDFSSIEPQDLICDFSRPEITEHPESKAALKGDEVQLSCTVKNGSIKGIHVIWRKDMKNISSTHSQVKTATQVTDEKSSYYKSVLRLFDVNGLRDSGSYQCILKTRSGELKSRKAELAVFVMPRFTSKPRDLVTTLNGDARFNCSATGFPKPKVYFTKYNNIHTLVKQRRVGIHKDTFIIHNITMDDVGLYWCFAESKAGLINTSFNINIRGKPEPVRQMLNKVVLLHDSVMFTCATTGWPVPEYVWLKDGLPVNMTSSNIKHYREHNTDRLIIISTKYSDAGEYSCLVSNRLGTTELTSRVKVVGDLSRQENVTSSDDSVTKQTFIAAMVFTASFTMVLTAFLFVAVLRIRDRRRCVLCPGGKKTPDVVTMDMYCVDGEQDYLEENTPGESPRSSTTFITSNLPARSDSNFLQTSASDSGSTKENREGSFDGRQSSGVCSMNSSTSSLESATPNHRNTFPFTNNTKTCYPPISFYDTSDDSASCGTANQCGTGCCGTGNHCMSRQLHRQSLLARCTDHKPPDRRKTSRTRDRRSDKGVECKILCDRSRDDHEGDTPLEQQKTGTDTV